MPRGDQLAQRRLRRIDTTGGCRVIGKLFRRGRAISGPKCHRSERHRGLIRPIMPWLINSSAAAWTTRLVTKSLPIKVYDCRNRAALESVEHKPAVRNFDRGATVRLRVTNEKRDANKAINEPIVRRGGSLPRTPLRFRASEFREFLPSLRIPYSFRAHWLLPTTEQTPRSRAPGISSNGKIYADQRAAGRYRSCRADKVESILSRKLELVA